MNKVHADESAALYRKQTRAGWMIFVACTALAAGGYYLQISLLAQVVLFFMALIGAAVSASREMLRLDFRSRRLRYQRHFLGWRTADINDDFDRVQGVLLSDNSIDRTTRGEIHVQPAWHVVLKYVGNPPMGLLVGIFVDQAAAMQEAEFLARKFGVSRVETLTRAAGDANQVPE